MINQAFINERIHDTIGELTLFDPVSSYSMNAES